MPNYPEIAREARLKVLDLIFKAQTSHIGSNFSCIDILSVLFEKIDLNKDKFVLSKGWAAASLYYFLWRKGRISQEDLDSYCQPDSKFIGLAEPIIPEIPIAGGSMGLGFPGAVGLALAKKIKKEPGHVYVLMSDGEMQIGTTWESALIAAQHDLNNLTVIVDVNRWCAMGKTEQVLDIENLPEKWQNFHFSTAVVDGHNFEQIEKAFNEGPLTDGPKVVVADTTKGKGVSFMENENLYHYKAPNNEEYEMAVLELRPPPIIYG